MTNIFDEAGNKSSDIKAGTAMAKKAMKNIEAGKHPEEDNKSIEYIDKKIGEKEERREKRREGMSEKELEEDDERYKKTNRRLNKRTEKHLRKNEPELYKKMQAMRESYLQFFDACATFLEDSENDLDTGSIPLENVPSNQPNSMMGDAKLLEEINAIYTPILVSQELDHDIQGRIQEACSKENVLVESNLVKFDADTRKAQLISLCSLLIARQANSPDYQAYKQASNVRKAMKLKIQKDNYAGAVALADKYLQNLSATGTSSVVRSAATDLQTVRVEPGTM